MAVGRGIQGRILCWGAKRCLGRGVTSRNRHRASFQPCVRPSCGVWGWSGHNRNGCGWAPEPGRARCGVSRAWGAGCDATAAAKKIRIATKGNAHLAALAVPPQVLAAEHLVSSPEASSPAALVHPDWHGTQTLPLTFSSLAQAAFTPAKFKSWSGKQVTGYVGDG